MFVRLVSAALLLCATPTAADVIRVARPRYQPMRPLLPDASPLGGIVQSEGTAPDCTNTNGRSIPCAVDIQYFGGPGLSNVKVYAVFWSSAVDSTISLGIGDFYRALTNSERVDWLTEYSTNLLVEAGSHEGLPGTQQVIGRGTFAGNYTLPSLSQTYPACPSPNQQLTCVSDEDIQAEIDFQVRQGQLPVPDANTLYAVHFPASVQVTSSGAVSCQAFCAYHSTFRAAYQTGVTQDVFYAVVPDLGSNGCELGCGPGTAFENTCMATSHEITESMTDSAVGLASTEDFPLGWYDTEPVSQGEVCDMCNQHTDTLDENGLTGCTLGDAGCYLVQQCFSQVVWNSDPSGHPNTLACVSSHYAANDYSIALSPNTLSLGPGQTASPIPVETTLTNGATQALTLSVTALPPGLTASLDATSVDAGATAHLTVSADANAPPLKDGVLVVQAAGTTTHSAALLVQVASDWSLSVSPSVAALLPGTSQTYTVSGQVTSGTAETVSLSPSVSGLPPQVSASFNPSTLSPGSSTSLLTLSAASGAPAAPPSTFTVTGVSASQQAGHTATSQVQVDTLPSAAFMSPVSGAVLSGTVSVQVTAAPGANATLSSITILVDANPPLSTGNASSVSWDTHSVSNGSHSLTVTVLDTDGGQASTSIHVTVSNILNDFSLGVSPQSLTLLVGGSGQLTLTTAVAAGSAELVSLNITGLPPGVHAALDPAQVTAGDTATVTLTAPSGTPAASANTVTLRGTSPSQASGHTVTASVSVQAQSSSASSGGCASTGGPNPAPALFLLLAGIFLRGKRPAPRESLVRAEACPAVPSGQQV